MKSGMDSEMPQLGYWKIRGLAEPIRMLLEYTNTKFQDKQYECGDGPTFDRSEWTNVKEKMGLDFPNLPYYIDGEIKITQSNAILRYIASKNNLVGETELEKAWTLEMQDVAMDFRNGAVRLFYNRNNYEDAKKDYLESLKVKLAAFDSVLKKRDWFCGKNLTFVDFVMYELLDQHRRLSSSCLNDFPHIESFMRNFEALEPLKSFLQSEKHQKLPINNKSASFL